MSKSSNAVSASTPFKYIFGFALGGSSYTVLFNAMMAFALIFYTQVLGLDYVLAGLALSITTFWDAVSDPIMGHISDNTKSRYGRRHPYVLFGGIAMVVFFFLLWAIPGWITGSWALFSYLLIVNFLFRTALTVFMIPYGALGFEVCTDYDGRCKLQATASVLGMGVNFFAIALGWRIFFPDRGEVDGTQFASNYFNMGLTFAIVSLGLVLFSIFATRRYVTDTRSSQDLEGNNLRAFFEDFKDILLDKRAKIVFLFFGAVQIGNVFTACFQAYVWIYFMKFTDWEKTVCHSIGMVFFVLGSLICTQLSKKMDKKAAVCLGAGLSIITSALLILIFYTGAMATDVKVVMPEGTAFFAGKSLSISLLVFSLLQGIYWMGTGIMAPLAVSMIADISEINKHETGLLKDGSYSAVYSFIMKAIMALGLFLQGFILKLVGFKEGADDQSPDAVERLVLVAFATAILFAVVALRFAMKYQIDRTFMLKIKKELAERQPNEADPQPDVN